MRGRVSYSNARDIENTLEQQYRDRWGDDEDLQATKKLYADNLGKELFDKVVLGQASEEETQQFEQLAREFGVSDKAIGRFMEEGDAARRASTEAIRADRQATNVQSVASSEEGRARGTGDAREPQLSDDQLDQGYWLSDDGTLIDPDGQPLFQRSDQLSFTQEGLLQQEAAQDPDRGRLTIPKSEETTGTLGQLLQSKDERVSRIATLLAKFQRYGVADLALADLTAALEAYSYLRSNKFTVEEYLRQGSLFGPTQLSSVQEGMLKAYETLKPASLSAAIKTYIRQLADGKAEFNGKPEDEVVEAALFHGGKSGLATWLQQSLRIRMATTDVLLKEAKVEGAAHRLKLNHAAYEIFKRMYEQRRQERTGTRQDNPFTGVFNDPALVRDLVNRLKEASREHPAQRNQAAVLARALKQAAEADGHC